MKKLLKIVFSALTLSTVTLSLASCGDNEGASTAMKNVFTVTYYDDAPTPVAIGYSYVIGGRAATFKNNDANSPYDYLSRSEKAPSAGKHYVFDEWKGSYENGDPVDLSKITADCNVYASFVEKDYSLKFRFRENSLYIRDEESQIITFDATYKDNEKLNIQYPKGTGGIKEYGYVPTLTGYTISAASDTTLYEGTEFTWASGFGAPTTIQGKGTFYLDRGSQNEDNPAYPVYLSNGESWLNLEKNLSSNPTLDITYNYENVKATFPVLIFDKAIDVNSKEYLTATPKDIIYVNYTEGFKLGTTSTDEVTLSYLEKILTFPAGTELTGNYLSNGDVINNGTLNLAIDDTLISSNYDGKPLDIEHIMGAAFLYPLA